MPSPTFRRKAVQRAPSAADIANSNRTMNSMLGRPRHSWMTDSSLPAAPPVVQRPRTSRRVTAPSEQTQRPAHSIDPQSQRNMIQQQQQQLREQEDRLAKESRSQTSLTTNNGPATLPSPQSTVHSPEAPITSASPRISTQIVQPVQTQVPQLPSSHSSESTQTPAVVAASAAESGMPATVPEASISGAAGIPTPAESSTLNTDRAAIGASGRSSTANTPATQAPFSLGIEGPSPAVTAANKRSIESQYGPGSAETQRAAKRLRTDSTAEFGQEILQRISSIIKAGGGQECFNRIERNRFSTVGEALKPGAMDFFILVLLQIHSQWSLSLNCVYDSLDLSPDVVDLSLTELGKVIGPNTSLRYSLQQYFTTFLGDLKTLKAPQFVHAKDQVRHFLRRFGKAWQSELMGLMTLGRPFLVSELRDELLCPSDRLQNHLFVYSTRWLASQIRTQQGESPDSSQPVLDEGLDNKMAKIFRENQAMERAWIGSTISIRDRQAARDEIARQLRALAPTGQSTSASRLGMANTQDSARNSISSPSGIESGVRGPLGGQGPISVRTSNQTPRITNFDPHFPQQVQFSMGQPNAGMPSDANRQRSADQQIYQRPTSGQPQNHDQRQYTNQQPFAPPQPQQQYSQYQGFQPVGVRHEPQQRQQQHHPIQVQVDAQVQHLIQSQGQQMYQQQQTSNTGLLSPQTSTYPSTFVENWSNGGSGQTSHGRQSHAHDQNTFTQGHANRYANYVASQPTHLANGASQGQQPLHQPPRRNIRMIDPRQYPHSADDVTSLATGLHLVRARSPPRCAIEPQRFHQFVQDFLAEPRVVRPHYALIEVKFNLSEEQRSRFPQSQYRNGQTFLIHTNNTLCVRLRLCKVPKPVDQDFSAPVAIVSPTVWPTTIFFTINGFPVTLKRKQHFRWDLPFEINGALVVGENCLRMSFPEHGNEAIPYWLMVETVVTTAEPALQKAIREGGHNHLPADGTRDEIRKRLKPSDDDDDDIILTDNKLTISIADPFSSVMCTIPVRSMHCKHLECFDLDNWLSSRPTKSSFSKTEPTKVDEWKCPICATDARPSQLRMDNYFKEIVDKLQAEGKGRTKQVVVDENADWTAVEEPEDSEDEEEDVALGHKGARKGSRSSTGVAGRPPAAAAEVIVLDDSD